MEELVRYLLSNLYLDFQGDISVDQVRELLREDDSREARQLLSKIIEEKGVDDLLITLADCLKDNLSTGVLGSRSNPNDSSAFPACSRIVALARVPQLECSIPRKTFASAPR